MPNLVVLLTHAVMHTKSYCLCIVYSPLAGNNFPFFYKREVVDQAHYRRKKLMRMANQKRTFKRSLSRASAGRQSTVVRMITPEMMGQLEEFRYSLQVIYLIYYRRRNKTKTRMNDKSPLINTPSKKDSSVSLKSADKLNSFEHGVLKTPVNPIRKKPTFRNSTIGPGLWSFDTIKEDPSPKQERKNEKEIEEDSFKSSSDSINSSRRRKIKKK